MRRYFKHVASSLLIPLTKWYLRKSRSFAYDGLHIVVLPGVFHPGLFYSTKFLLSNLAKHTLRGQKFLELGCGSALISLWAARAGALVTASDISAAAIENARYNAAYNQMRMSFHKCDLFEAIPQQTFDWIVINPPYYARPPVTEADYAWFCGEHFEYFRKLFSQLPHYTDTNSKVKMVLTKGCDLQSIKSIAELNHYQLILEDERLSIFDGRDYIFSIHAVR